MKVFILILKIFRKLRVYKIRFSRFLRTSEYKYLSKGRIVIRSDYLYDIDFLIDLDESDSRVIIGEKVFFRDGGRITAHRNGKVLIGDNVFFNRGCSLNCLSSVEIGSDCLFGENVKIYDHNHRFSDRSVPLSGQGYSMGAVKIGKNTRIGSNTVVLKGVTIGENVVIGANNLIVSDVPSGAVVKSYVSDNIELRH